jgi:hypothetical protein
MAKEKYFEEIRLKKIELAGAIKEYVKSQLNLWQKVPYLALQAEGRGGFNEDYQRAYEDGYWSIDDPNGSTRYCLVDCETGELVFVEGKRTKRITKLDPDQIISINLEHLDAAKVVKDLREQSKWENSDRFYFSGNPRTPETWRNVRIKKYNLQPDIYRRKKKAVPVFA